MNLCLINHNFRYEIEKLIRIFLPFEKISFFDSVVYEDNTAITEIKTIGEDIYAFAELYIGSKKYRRSQDWRYFA